MAKKEMVVEYMCTYCGQKTLRYEKDGRPEPGRCDRRNQPGAITSRTAKPHRWIVNRKMEKTW